MTYFERYDLPVQLSVDQKLLKKKYLELSRQFHPDYFTLQDGIAQQQALEQSALVNNAYKTFSSPEETIKYVLQLKGLLAENEKYALPPAFLMEMMELNETIADAQFEPAQKDAALASVRAMEDELYLPVKQIVETYRDAPGSDTDLEAVKEYYFKKKYIERLKEQLR